jgi:D-glycero-D-manno-heptose 1,7-bisphosphate phosphatase
MSRAAVFLDRDGVLVESLVRDGVPRPAQTLADLRVLPGVREACERLHDAGFILVVVTNQPDVARGTLTAEAIEEMHRELRAQLPLDDISVCLHDDADGCDCRKPQPGMLLAAAARWDLDLGESYLVGDRWRDIEAARRARCHAVFVDRGYDEPLRSEPDVTVADLPEAAEWILASESVGRLESPAAGPT